jgi:hypothetical protein
VEGGRRPGATGRLDFKKQAQKPMNKRLFNKFVASCDSLQVYEGSKLIFVSNKDRLLPLMEYIGSFSPFHQQVTIFDKIVGNAAALLSVKANCREVYSPLGSQLAIRTLDKYGIIYHFTEIVPYVKQPDGVNMCPMEKLSIDKEPEEFHEEVSIRLKI